MDEEGKRRKREKKWHLIKPHKWQDEVLRETVLPRGCVPFVKEIVVSKGNRVGGSLWTAMMIFVRTTGFYDDVSFEWHGRRHNRPTNILIIGYNADQIIESLQRIMFGLDRKNWGVGEEDDLYPIFSKEICHECTFSMSEYNKGCIDTVLVPNKYGGKSRIVIRTQSQDVGGVFGGQYDDIYVDEFPWNDELISQLRQRVHDKSGFVFYNGTPEIRKADGRAPSQLLLRKVKLEKPLTPEGIPMTYYRRVTKYEAEHIPKEKVDAELAGMPEIEAQFRIFGEAVMGDQQVFPFYVLHHDVVDLNPKEMPKLDECRHIFGLDWGKMDYGAFSCVAIDYKDVHHVWHYEKIRDLEPYDVARLIKTIYNFIGFKAPVVAGRDIGVEQMQSNRAKPISVRSMFIQEGVNMLKTPAYNAFENSKSNFVLTGLVYLNKLMRSGQFKIVNIPGMELLKDEFRTIYMKDGNVAKRKEARFDGIESVRYAVIMGRFAQYDMKGFHRDEEQRAKTSYSIYR